MPQPIPPEKASLPKPEEKDAKREPDDKSKLSTGVWESLKQDYGKSAAGWVEGNVLAPLYNEAIVKPVNTVIDKAEKLHVPISKLQTAAVPEAGIDSVGFYAQQMASTAGNLAWQVGAGVVAGKYLRVGGEALALKAEASGYSIETAKSIRNLAANRQFANISGAALYGAAIDPEKGQSRIGNSFAAAEGMFLFDGANKLVGSSKFLDARAIGLRAATGAPIGVSQQFFSSWIATGNVDVNPEHYEKAAVSGAFMNTMLPGFMKVPELIAPKLGINAYADRFAKQQHQSALASVKLNTPAEPGSWVDPKAANLAISAGRTDITARARSSATEETNSGLLKNPIASGVISGVPAGFLGAKMDSIQRDKQFASWADITKSVYGRGVIGGTFGGIAFRAKGADLAETSNRDSAKPVLKTVVSPSIKSVESTAPEKIVEPTGTQLDLDFGKSFARSVDTEPLSAERMIPLPEPPQARINAADNAQLELKYPEPLTPVGQKAYELLRHLENLNEDENAKISEGKYPITVKEAQAMHVLMDEWVPGAQRLYNQIAARGSVAKYMAYDAWVESSLSKVKADLPRFYEHALVQGHPDNDVRDRSKFVGQYLKRDPIGLESPEDVDRFLSVWRRTKPLTAWLDYPGDIHCPTLMKMIRWGHVDEIPDNALQPIAEHFKVYDQPFTDDLDIKALVAAAPGWAVSALVPIDVATKLAEMPPQKRIAADPAVVATRKQFEDPKDSAKVFFTGEEGEAVRAAFFKNVDEISQLSPRLIIKKMQYEDSLPLAVDVLYGDTISPEHKLALLQGVNSFRHAPQILAGIDLPTFKEAFDKLTMDNPIAEDAKGNERYFDWQSRSATILATVFKKNWPNWLDVQQKSGRDNFQATTWLHADEPAEFKGLSQFLLQHGRKSVSQLERISDAWSEVKGNGKIDDFKEALRIGLLSKYKVINDASFAEEASRWNVPEDKYESYEKRFIVSKDLPSPFPLNEKWSVGGLTGCFIPRDDPRGLFLGEHTNCCQNPGGNGESSAWYGQENPKSGFFVVEDSNGEVVAQSWSLVTDDGGLVFDNVEAKGLEKRQDAVRQIYQQAANSLTSRFHTITMGTENSDLILSGLPDAGEKTQKMPVEFSGYTDAKNQVLLALSDTVVATPFEPPMLRGALSIDKPAMSEISKERFPSGWQALPWEPATRGLVLDHKTEGVLGYALFEPANRYVSDIAIKPGVHPKYGHNLTSNLFRTLKTIGGDWTADMRSSTTYRMVQRAAASGHVKIISDTVDDEPMGTEQMHHVVFNVDAAKGKSTETTESASTDSFSADSQP